MNVIMLSGNLGKDAELKILNENTSLLTFSIAVTKRGYKKQNGEEVPDKTTWVNIKMFNKDGLAPFLKKGIKVLVRGELEIQEHEGKYYTSVLSNEIEFLSKKEDTAQDAPQAPAQQSQPTQGNFTDELGEDDLPF